MAAAVIAFLTWIATKLVNWVLLKLDRLLLSDLIDRLQ